MAIVDCYVDEPSVLGVPPYISPYPRYAWGAVVSAGHEPVYATVDTWRRKEKFWEKVRNADIVYFTGGALVPGKYLRTMPASMHEILAMAGEVEGKKILAGPVARFSYTGRVRRELEDRFDWIAVKDGEALVYDILSGEGTLHRRKSSTEWRRWAQAGAPCIQFVKDFPSAVIAEIETYKGCVRWISGGCSFCTDVLFGEPVFREPAAVVEEIAVMYNLGLRNFRIGGQTCIYSYMADGVGETETPEPNPGMIKKLFSGIWTACPEIEVLHLDNANPAVIATHPEKAREVTKILVEHTTPGNVVAFGMESADPVVIERNNLNATPDQVMKAVEILNEFGRARGENGLPLLLPGINFLGGLDGETKNTYRLNYAFLEEVLRKDLWVRRINIRQVAGVRKEFRLRHRSEFQHFKFLVRKNIDMPMLRRVVPENTVLKRIWTEVHEGKTTFGRQIATYPLLAGFPYQIQLGKFVDGIIIGHGERSITCIEYPLDVNRCPLAALNAVPGLPKKLAGDIVAGRPFKPEELAALLKARLGEAEARALLKYFS
ncbi:MAG: radical SAM protein [Thermoplasmata archaeon]|nr:radical SAM protein [Thermoplasmata archaeon]